MVFVNVDEPVRDVHDTGHELEFSMAPGSRIYLHGTGSSMVGGWEVLAQIREVVLVKRTSVGVAR